MNASPLASSRTSPETSSPVTPQGASSPAKRRSLRSLLGTITGICFIFGALAAVQVRTISNIQKSRVERTQSENLQKKFAAQSRAEAQKAAREAAAKNATLVATINELKDSGNLTRAQIKSLTGQIKSLQVQACLTPVAGRGLRIVLSDNPQASGAGGNPSLPMPGLVHDYDILQVVNELRAVKADAIAVSGADGKQIRITGTTPIRCVGPAIQINWNPVAAPFTIEAIGAPKTMQSAISMPGGIVENLTVQGAVGVKITPVSNLVLPPTESALTTPTTNISTVPAVPTPDSKGL